LASLLSFVWLSDSRTKFLIELKISLDDWTTPLWFYTTHSRLFIDVRYEWSLHKILVIQGKFLLGQVLNYLNLILAYLGRSPHQLVLEFVLLSNYIPLVFSLSHFFFFLPSFDWGLVSLKKEYIILLLFQSFCQTTY